jgi:hypothetical protein
MINGPARGVFESSVVLQVNGEAGCSLGMTSNGGEKAGRLRIAVQALYRLRARLATAVPAELALLNSGWPLRWPDASMYSFRICSSE